MQMWMVWMIWIVFTEVFFGLLADAISECRGYAKSWFYPGLFLGPIAILILLTKPDPEGQIRYIDIRKTAAQGPRMELDPKTGMMIPSMVTESDRSVVIRNGYRRNVTKIMQIGTELAGIAVILRLATLILSIFTNEISAEKMHIIFEFSALILLFVMGMKCTESNKALGLGLLPLLLLLIRYTIDMGRMIETKGSYGGFHNAWRTYGGYVITTLLCLVAFFIVLVQSQGSRVKTAGGKTTGRPRRWGTIVLGSMCALMIVFRLLQGAEEVGEYLGKKNASTGLTVWINLLSTLISICFYMAYICVALREGLAAEAEEATEAEPVNPGAGGAKAEQTAGQEVPGLPQYPKYPELPSYSRSPKILQAPEQLKYLEPPEPPQYIEAPEPPQYAQVPEPPQYIPEPETPQILEPRQPSQPPEDPRFPV